MIKYTKKGVDYEILKESIRSLDLGCEIYKTSNDYYFHYRKFKNERLYFDIPNHRKPKQPSVKSVPISYVMKVLYLLEEKREFARKESEYKDCRYAAIYAFAKLVFKEKLIKQRGKILLSN